MRLSCFAKVSLAIACVSLGSVFIPAGVRGQQPPVSELVKVSGEAISVHQCIQPTDENRQLKLSTLRFHVHIKNVSTKPLIIYRYDPAVFDARLSRTLADIEKAEFHFKERPPFHSVPPRNFEEAQPTNEFRVLQPNESFTYESPESLTFGGTQSFDTGINKFEGDFFLQLKAATWIWETEKAEKLQQRWTRIGSFFYSDVTIEPFPFTVPKTGATTPRCDTLSVK